MSLDGIKERHDEIRGVPGLFDRAVATYKELRTLEKFYRNFNVNIETTVSSYNDGCLLENYEYFVNKLKAHTVFTLLTRDKPRDPATKFFNIERYEAYAQKMEEAIKERILTGYDTFPFADVINAKLIVRHKLIAKLVRENKYQIPCYAGELGAAIFANGDVYPCELRTDLKLGNIRDYNFDFNKAAQQYLGFKLQHRWLDLAFVAPGLYPELASRFRALDDWTGSFDIPNYARHNAMADSLATAQLGLIIFARARQKGVHDLQGLQDLDHVQRMRQHYRA